MTADTTPSTSRRSSRARRAVAGVALAAGLVGVGAVATSGTASARANVYSATCSDGVCGIYKNGNQIGIYAVGSGRTVWF